MYKHRKLVPWLRLCTLHQRVSKRLLGRRIVPSDDHRWLRQSIMPYRLSLETNESFFSHNLKKIQVIVSPL